ncbi:hypothetical protein [Candidatus Frankia alpina]|uniref:Uncharacterized protein n=1 Tax=Candidatus Frankia alpina TaxID=2699483 RepID=A0A4S5ERC6_9ACTN|nr:hypothetical protein [Candidatus Frankia alpina]THJ74713.1 hypothetical protein E7Y31_09825 [Candidatus Frankia alpina]
MTLTEARTLIGTDRLWLAPGTGKVLIGIHVHDARMSYGRPQLQIQPISGRGSQWIDADLTQPVED